MIGLTFVNSVVDLTFLDNSVFNGNLKVLVHQETNGRAIGQPTLWFLCFHYEAMGNSGLENAWKYVNQIGAMLHPYTRMGQRFAYNNIWTFPNLPADWVLEETYVRFRETGELDGLYWQDPSVPVEEEDGEQVWVLPGRTVNADFLAVVNNNTHLTQNHTVHISIPGNPNIDTSPFHQKKGVLDQMGRIGFPISDPTHIYILELFNRAISTDEIVLSTIALYQIVEVLLKAAEGDRIAAPDLNGLRTYLEGDPALSAFAERVLASSRNITIQTSAQLLTLGLETALGAEASQVIDHSDFHRGDVCVASWRIQRKRSR